MTSTRILVELVIVLGSAAVVTIVFQALRLPVVLGYVLAGLVIGPNLTAPLVPDVGLVHVLSELGVSLLVFSIGLELPVKTMARVGMGGALIALGEVGFVVAVGTLVARLVGLEGLTAVFVGACLGISSTMLVAKSFDELGWKGGFTEVVFAILVFEDVIAVVLLAVLTAAASGAGVDAERVGALIVRLAGFLVVLLGGGLLIVPRVVRWVAVRARRETLAITALLACFGASALAAEAGYSVALGAFIAGVWIAESGQGRAVLALIEIGRDVFAMVFFVSVGMSIDPALLVSELPRILVLAAVVLLCKPASVAAGLFLGGHGMGYGVRAGVSLAQIGEFSFVIAGVIGDPVVLAIAVGVSCVTTIASSLAVRRSDAIADHIARGLPGRLATFVSFYESWLERLQTRDPTWWRRQRRTIRIIAGNAIAIAVIVIAGATWRHHGEVLTAMQIAGVAVAAAPFAYFMFRRMSLLAKRLAEEVIPPARDVDLGRASRRALALTFEVAITMAVMVPIVAVVQSFVPSSFAVLLLVAGVLALAMRRRIADFEGHVRASSDLIVELLGMPDGDARFVELATILPGFGGTARVTIGPASAGKTLAELDLHARTGASVLAIMRAERGISPVDPELRLEEGDVVALAGSEDAIAAARRLFG
jgi:CPA2 family monovalent cation:H+ antiporter-2